MANHFLTKYSNNTKKFDESGLNTLKNYRWPGNIRELENLIKKVSVLSTENLIDRYNIENLLSYGHTSSSYTEQNSKISNKKINLKKII